MITRTRTAAALVALALLSGPAIANDQPAPDDSAFALGIKIGTLGAGAEGTYAFSDHVSIRANINYLDYSYDDEIDDIDWELTLNYFSLVGMLDWHPFGDAFRLTVGLVKNDNDFVLDATPTEPVTIGDTKYPAALAGTLKGDVNFEDVAPYIGIGFGNAARSRGNWSVTLDLGVILQSYDITLTADGPANQIPGFKEDLKQEEQNIEDDLNNFKIYPVLTLGLARRF